jgi:hypothetical protein
LDSKIVNVQSTMLEEGDARVAGLDKTINRTIRFEHPIPVDSKQAARLLRNIMEPAKEYYGFTIKMNTSAAEFALGRTTTWINSLQLDNIPELIVPMLEGAVAVAGNAWEKYKEEYILNPGKMLRVEFDPNVFKNMAQRCIGCHAYLNGGWGAGCVSVSWLWGDSNRNKDYLRRYLEKKIITKTPAMVAGTIRHEMLLLMRNPVEEVGEFIERLLTQKPVKWVLPICSPANGLRARPPDLIVSELSKVNDGFQLIHWIVEDKPHPRGTYYVQVWGEGKIAADFNMLVHNEPQAGKTRTENDDAFKAHRGVMLNWELEKKMKESGMMGKHDLLHTQVYVVINPYADKLNPDIPLDHYDYLPHGTPKDGVKEPLLWSVDGRVVDENSGYLDTLTGARSSRVDALVRGYHKPPKRDSQKKHYKFTKSRRPDLRSQKRFGEEEEWSMHLPGSEK